MKKSISQWAFPPETKLKECMTQAKKAGFEAIEVAITEKGEINLQSTREDMEKIVQEAKGEGLELSSLATGLFWDYSLSSNDSQVREKAKNIVKKMLELASYLKVKTILVVPGAVNVPWNPESEIVPYEAVYERVSNALKEAVKVAEEYKVNIGVENVWNMFLLSPLEMRNFIDEVKSEYVGVYFDVGNVLISGFPEQWIRILGNRIRAVHFKDFKRAIGNINGFVDLLEGDVNWPEVMKAFREIGYQGYVTAELFPPKFHSQHLIEKTSLAMDRILGRDDK